MTSETITNLIASYGYLAVAFLVAIENIFPPIPSELVLTFAGFITLTNNLNVWGMILAATVGAIVGALVLYYLGTIFDQAKINRFVNSRFGKFFGLSEEKIARVYNYFYTHGKKASFFGRFVPFIRSVISLPAGMSRFPLKTFLLYTTLGTLIWNTVLIFAGRLAGSAYEEVIHHYKNLFVPLIIVLIILAILYALLKRKFARKL